MDLVPRLQGLVAHRLNIEPQLIKRDSQFVDDLGADSLAVVDLICDLEDAFDLDIPEEDLQRIRTFGDALDYVEAHAAP